MRTVFSGNAMKPHYGAAGGAAVAPEFEARMREIVVGQEAAIKAVARTIRLLKAGLAPYDKPAGVFLLLGPTGVGKTMLAEAMARVLHGEDRYLLRINMNEYMDRHEVARLIGAPPGYLGHRETQPIFTQPKLNMLASEKCDARIVLLDEIEKAHQRIFDFFLGIFDNGRLRLGDNTDVSFKNTIFLLTSNLGAREVQALGESVGFGRLVSSGEVTDGAKARTIKRALVKKFKPEFLNRVTETVTFHPLTREHVARIVDLEMDKLQEFITDRLGFRAPQLVCCPKVREWLVDKGMSPDWGAREVVRLISKEITVQVAELLLAGNDGAAMHVQLADDRICVAVKERR